MPLLLLASRWSEESICSLPSLMLGSVDTQTHLVPLSALLPPTPTHLVHMGGLTASAVIASCVPHVWLLLHYSKAQGVFLFG